MKGHEDIVRLLLINNADKNILSLDGSTAQTCGKFFRNLYIHLKEYLFFKLQIMAFTILLIY